MSTAKVLNLYRPPAKSPFLHESTAAQEYDVNSIIPFRILETDQVRLEPLVPSKHLTGLLGLPAKVWDGLREARADKATALEWIETNRSNPVRVIMAVMDKQCEAAGRDGFVMRSDPDLKRGIVGPVIIHPSYQKTHINTHAMYLVLNFFFELGFARVLYNALIFNKGSIASAERFGFQYEGILRNEGLQYARVTDDSTEKHCIMTGSWFGSITDEDWKRGGRARLQALREREPVDTSGSPST